MSNETKWLLDHDMSRINVIDVDGRVIAVVPRQGKTYDEALSIAMRIAALPIIVDAVKAGRYAAEEVTSAMTVGDRFTNAGQSLIDALPALRAAAIAVSA